jgi:hypothetical protein
VGAERSGEGKALRAAGPRTHRLAQLRVTQLPPQSKRKGGGFREPSSFPLPMGASGGQGHCARKIYLLEEPQKTKRVEFER